MHSHEKEGGWRISATAKPCRAKSLLLLTSRNHSVTFSNNTGSTTDGGRRRAAGGVGHKQAKRSSTQSSVLKQPICHSDQAPSGPANRPVHHRDSEVMNWTVRGERLG